jgi:hypothetical protein
MRGYFGLGQLSATDKTDILDQHKSVYNGYQTMQPQVSNRQPLYVYDDAGDKDGFVVNNRGEIKKYTNMGINEGVNDKNVCKSCGRETNEGKVCEQCGGGETNEGKVCEQCGGETNEGKVCEQCGGTGKTNIQELGGMDDGHPRFGNKKFPNKMSPEEIDDLLRGDEDDYNDEEDYKDRSMYNPYYGDKNFNFGDEDDNDDEDVDYIELDEDDDCELEENEWGAYDFESNGPNSGYNVNELEDNTINSYEPMQSAFDDDDDDNDDDNDDDDDEDNYNDDDDDDYDEDDDMDDGSETVPSFNSSGEYLGMVEPNGDMEIDDDLKESFFIQKNKITEMFNRFNKYN